MAENRWQKTEGGGQLRKNGFRCQRVEFRERKAEVGSVNTESNKII
jgi:hypothetical protein